MLLLVDIERCCESIQDEVDLKGYRAVSERVRMMKKVSFEFGGG